MKNIKDLSDEELIELFKKNNYCFMNIAKEFGVAGETVRREFIKRGINYNKIVEEWKNDIREAYEKSPKLCKHCGKPIPWEKRMSNEYCNRSCLASENNIGKVRNPRGAVENLHITTLSEKFGRELTESEVKEHNKQYKHNYILRTRYKDYNIPEVGFGCCFTCGTYHCENKFCKEHDFKQLIQLVKHLKFNAQTIGTQKVFEEFERIRKILYDLYWVDGLSSVEIGEKFEYCGSNGINLLELFNIPRRSFSEASSNALMSGKYSLPDVNPQTGLAKNINQEWHITWTGESVFLRSSYEIEYAEYLDENQISYSVEELRIEYYDTQQNKTRIAIPDFYLSSTNEIVEIKSDFTLDIQEMLDKFDAYKENGYIPKLILEGKEVDIYRIEEEIDEKRINKIKTKNINSFRNNGNSDIDRDKT